MCHGAVEERTRRPAKTRSGPVAKNEDRWPLPQPMGGNLSSPEDQRVEDGSIGDIGHDKWAGRICTGLMLPAPSRLAAGGTPRPQRFFGQGKGHGSAAACGLPELIWIGALHYFHHVNRTFSL